MMSLLVNDSLTQLLLEMNTQLVSSEQRRVCMKKKLLNRLYQLKNKFTQELIATQHGKCSNMSLSIHIVITFVIGLVLLFAMFNYRETSTTADSLSGIKIDLKITAEKLNSVEMELSTIKKKEKVINQREIDSET